MSVITSQQLSAINAEFSMLSNQLTSARAQIVAYSTVIDPDSNDWTAVINAIKEAKLKLRDINYNIASSSLSNLHM